MSHIDLLVQGFIHNFERVYHDLFIPFGIQLICCDYYGYPDFWVIARFRPSSETEKREEKRQDFTNHEPNFHALQQIVMKRPILTNHSKPFIAILDHIFKISTTQKEIYNYVGRKTIDDVLHGYNATVLAYGQTGSGKTYTMFGPERRRKPESIGLVQRCINELFNKLSKADIIKWNVQVSFIQIYKEHLADLLQPTSSNLQIHTNFHTNIPYVKNLKYVSINNIDDFLINLGIAMTNRIVAAHRISCCSSRCHMLLMFNIEQKYHNGYSKICKLNFCDLSGSEDIRKALGPNPDPERMKEAICINRSLTALTTAINNLSKERRPSYRSSSLTHILQYALGGNCKTTMIVTASPHQLNRSETIRSLRFAMTAKNVKNTAKINMHTSEELEIMKANENNNGLGLDLEDILNGEEPPSSTDEEEEELDIKNESESESTETMWRRSLKPGDELDCKDECGLWWTAKIVGYKLGDSNKLRIRYNGWGDQFDEFIDRWSDRISVHKSMYGKNKYKYNQKIIREGYMSKEGKIFKTWRKRYFILNDNGILSYYHNKSDGNPINSLNVKEMNKTKRTSFGKTKQFAMELHTNTRIWKFLCENEIDLVEWMQAINHCSVINN